MLPLCVSNTLIKVPFSEAVASLVPCRFKAMQDKGVSCASIFNGCFSVFARSITEVRGREEKWLGVNCVNRIPSTNVTLNVTVFPSGEGE